MEMQLLESVWYGCREQGSWTDLGLCVPVGTAGVGNVCNSNGCEGDLW